MCTHVWAYLDRSWLPPAGAAVITSSSCPCEVWKVTCRVQGAGHGKGGPGFRGGKGGPRGVHGCRTGISVGAGVVREGGGGHSGRRPAWYGCVVQGSYSMFRYMTGLLVHAGPAPPCPCPCTTLALPLYHPAPAPVPPWPSPCTTLHLLLYHPGPAPLPPCPCPGTTLAQPLPLHHPHHGTALASGCRLGGPRGAS